MSLRFFTDHCVPKSVAESLGHAGHEVLLLREHISIGSEDPVVIAEAQELSAILVSLNGDFSDIVTYPPFLYKGIVSLQVRNHPEIISSLMHRLMNYLSVHPNMVEYEGQLLLVQAHRIRIRR